MPIERSVKFGGNVTRGAMRTAFDKSQRDLFFCYFSFLFMHDQKVHSFKIASALFPPIASVSTLQWKLFVTMETLARINSSLISVKCKKPLLQNEIIHAIKTKCLI